MKQKATLIIDGKEIDVKIDTKKRWIEIAEEDLKKLKKPSGGELKMNKYILTITEVGR